jgi:HD superfamily phosphohydrolase
MLHDLGHFPYAHALKDCVSQKHEHLGAQIIAADEQICSIIEQSLNSSVSLVCTILDDSLPCTDRETTFCRNVLSGTLDPDKLDYLSRDALFCGIPYGIQDASYIIRHLCIPEGTAQIGVPEEAIGSVEHLLFAKYSMYRNVYWHQGTRSATAMIKKAVYHGLSAQLFTEKDLYHQDDQSFAQLFAPYPESVSAQLFQSVRNNSLLALRATLPFSVENQVKELATDQEKKSLYEQELFQILRKQCTDLAPHEVIIDIPEDVSFESDILVKTDRRGVLPFHEVDELFTSDVVRTFTESLRKVRVYTRAELDGEATQKQVERMVYHA